MSHATGVLALPFAAALPRRDPAHPSTASLDGARTRRPPPPGSSQSVQVDILVAGRGGSLCAVTGVAPERVSLHERAEDGRPNWVCFRIAAGRDHDEEGAPHDQLY